MKIKTLGIFDSGLGGYSVYDALKTKGPKIQYVLYADQKNAPYGNQSATAIINHVRNALMWFQDQAITTVLLACNTASAVALKTLRDEFPSMTIVGIIDLTLHQIEQNDCSLAVVSTQATMESHAYKKAWSSPLIQEYALPELVDLIENDFDLLNVNQYLKEASLTIKQADYMILACTHFPLVEDVFKEVFEMEILDSRKPILDYVKQIAGVCDKDSVVYTSGHPDKMAQQIKVLFNKDEKVSGL
ncbi:glutamate racemase [Erysipelothrix urinaevulpis]|uniref:glutamate racemase n=1 Tax=Erysipelothrix urinaevulpis TaxID=2683717 RepID=UPI00135B7897|nr:aspartate/glutamate racemase family protein [Erysipelothrix urinaevulpis]